MLSLSIIYESFFSQLREAIISMDEVLIDREGVDKLQQLLPTQEELKIIAEHQEMNKELPLGNYPPPPLAALLIITLIIRRG